MKQRVFKVFSQVMEIPVEKINEDLSPDTVAEWDSLKHMNLVLALEEEFGVQFSDEQIVNLLSVKMILDALKAF